MKIIYFINCCLLFSFSTAAQNVGIGTLSPANKLHVINSALSINAIHGVNSGTANGTSWDQNNNFAGVHGEAGVGTVQYQAGIYGYHLGTGINSGGVVGAYSSSIWGGLGYTDANGLNWGIYTPANLYAGGNIGIGTVTPLAKLHIVGSIRMVDGNQAANKIMVSDANGTASWQTIAVGGMGGSGTLNNVPRFTPNGTTLANSQITDNGTNVGINIAVPLAKLDVRTSTTDIAVKGLSTASDGTGVSGTCSVGTNAWGVYGESTTGYAGYFNGKMQVTDKIGIGVAPGYPLNFASTLGDKISFYGTSGAHYGIGIQGNLLQVHTINNTSDIAFGYGQSSALTTNVIFKGDGKVGIGTLTPANTLDVSGNLSYTGNFVNTAAATDNAGIRGTCNVTPFYGYGVVGNGGYRGVDGAAILAGTGDRYGLYGMGANGAGNNFGMRSSASGGVNAYGVYGDATGASNSNWAGYFGSGNVFVQNRLSVGVSIPLYAVHVLSNSPASITGSFVNSSTTEGTGLRGACYNTPNLGTGVLGQGGVIGVTGLAELIGAGNRTGIEGYGLNGTGKNYGVYGSAAGGTNAYGVYGNSDGVNGTGVYGRNYNTAEEGYGVQGYGGHAGVYGEASLPGTGQRYGVDGYAKNGAVNFGVSGSASGGSYAYGIYGIASGASNSNWAGYFDGSVVSTTGVYATSDRKLKKDIEPLNNALLILNQLKPSMYTFKTTEYKQMNLPEGLQYGLIADEVQQVMPGAVKKAIQPATFENHDEHKGKKLSDEVEFNAVNYTEMIPVLIAAVKEQQIIITDLKKQLEEMKTAITELKMIKR